MKDKRGYMSLVFYKSNSYTTCTSIFPFFLRQCTDWEHQLCTTNCISSSMLTYCPYPNFKIGLNCIFIVRSGMIILVCLGCDIGQVFWWLLYIYIYSKQFSYNRDKISQGDKVDFSFYVFHSPLISCIRLQDICITRFIFNFHSFKLP